MDAFNRFLTGVMPSIWGNSFVLPESTAMSKTCRVNQESHSPGAFLIPCFRFIGAGLFRYPV